MSISQKDAVVKATLTATGLTKGTFVAKDVVTKDQLNAIEADVVGGIMAGDVEYSKPKVLADVKRYTKGLVNNHFRKAKELNGGSKYTPATTRDTTGTPKTPKVKKVKVDDPALNTLYAILAKTAKGTPEYTDIENKIKTREVILGARPVVDVKIDAAVLPKEVADMIQ